MEASLKSVDGPPPLSENPNIGYAMDTWIPAIQKYMVTYPFGDDKKKIVGNNEFVSYPQTCNDASVRECINQPAYKYVRNAPLGFDACAEENGSIKKTSSGSSGIVRGMWEDILGITQIQYFGNPNSVECQMLKGAVGIRMQDNSRYRTTAALADTANGWTVEKKCVAKTDFLTYNKGSSKEFHIPISKCKKDKEEFQASYKKTSNHEKSLLFILILVLAIFILDKIIR